MGWGRGGTSPDPYIYIYTYVGVSQNRRAPTRQSTRFCPRSASEPSGIVAILGVHGEILHRLGALLTVRAVDWARPEMESKSWNSRTLAPEQRPNTQGQATVHFCLIVVWSSFHGSETDEAWWKSFTTMSPMVVWMVACFPSGFSVLAQTRHNEGVGALFFGCTLCVA